VTALRGGFTAKEEHQNHTKTKLFSGGAESMYSSRNNEVAGEISEKRLPKE
jgi:hypothetical protein